MADRVARPALAVFAVAGFLLIETLALPGAWLAPEEAATVLRARGAEGFGGGETGMLYPLLLWPVARLLSAESFYELVRVLNVLLWTAAFVPAFALVRRCASGPVAIAAAALAVLVPAAVYSTAVLPDALAFLLALSALALAARYAETRGAAASAGAFGLALAAALVRPWLAALPLALGVAFALTRISWRDATRWPYSSVFALGAGALYAALAVAGSPPLGDVLRAVVGSVAAAAVGFGVVPWLVVLATVERSLPAPVGVLFVVAAPLLAVSAGLTAAADGRVVEERPLVVLSPLVFGLAAGAWNARALPMRRIGGPAVLTALALLAVPPSLENPARSGAASLSVAERVLGSMGPALPVLMLLTIALAALLADRPVAIALSVGAGLVIVGQLGAWTDARAAADAPREPRSWVDEAVGEDARVTLVSPGAAGEASQALIWNRSLRGVVSVDPAQAEPATGALGPAPSALAVAAPGLDLAGEELASGPDGRLLRVGDQLRLAFAIEGLYPDGWSTGDAFYRRFGGPGVPGTVDVTVSRKLWGGPDKPGQVVIVSRPLGGEPFAERITDIHSAQERVVSIPVPPPPFEIKVAIGPTFSPADYGQPDSRQLGAQLRFVYRRNEGG